MSRPGHVCALVHVPGRVGDPAEGDPQRPARNGPASL
jgi:hypothetical protein